MKRKKVIAFGCSHGRHLSPYAKEAILTMIDRWKPDVRIHLGDFWDTSGWRTGAKDACGEKHDHLADIDAGLEFLRETRANVICIGNHEDRIIKAARHNNDDRIQSLAQETMGHLEARVALNNAVLISEWSVHDWYKLGGYRWGHGTIWSANYIRESAQTFGNCVVAHGHRAGVAVGATLDQGKAYAVGCLCKPFDMDYAKARKSTLAWSGGFVWGECSANSATLWLHEQPRGEKKWRLPI